MSNQDRLNQLVEAALSDGRPEILRKAADRMQALFEALGRDGPTPALAGIDVWMLTDARDRLSAAAFKQAA